MKMLMATLALLLAGSAHTQGAAPEGTGLYPAIAAFRSYVAAGASIRLINTGDPGTPDDDTLIATITPDGTLAFGPNADITLADTIEVTIEGATRTFPIAGTIGPSGVVWVYHTGPDGENLRIPLVAAVRRERPPTTLPGTPPLPPALENPGMEPEPPGLQDRPPGGPPNGERTTPTKPPERTPDRGPRTRP